MEEEKEEEKKMEEEKEEEKKMEEEKEEEKKMEEEKEEEKKMEEEKEEKEEKEELLRYLYVYVKNSEIGGYIVLQPEGVEYLKNKSPNKIKKYIESRCKYIKRERDIKKSEFNHYAMVTALVRVQQRYIRSFMEYLGVQSFAGFTEENLNQIYYPPGLNIFTTIEFVGLNKYQELYNDYTEKQKPTISVPTDIHKQIFTALTKLTASHASRARCP